MKNAYDAKMRKKKVAGYLLYILPDVENKKYNVKPQI